MKTYTHFKKILGIGLIEVLVTTVIISTGLLSVATLQGNFLGTSAENKIQEEAKNLCNTKLEQLRDSIENTSTTYQALTGSDEDSITGINETYTRSWSIVDGTDTPERKEITITCSWPTDNKIIVQGIISFQDMATALKVAANKAGFEDSADSSGAGLPIGNMSTNGGSSDEINDTNISPDDIDDYIKNNDPNETLTKIELANGNYSLATACGDLTIFPTLEPIIDPDNVITLYTRNLEDTSPYEKTSLYTRRVNYNIPDNTEFPEAIELFKKEYVDAATSPGYYCVRKVRFNGGVIIPISGTVYVDPSDSINQFTPATSESGTFCAFTIESASGSVTDTVADSITDKINYVCYIGGNCVNGTAGTTATLSDDIFKCPTETLPVKTYQDIVQGGWRGTIGLLGLTGAGGSDKGYNLCFQEEILGSTPIIRDLARRYKTVREAGDIAGVSYQESEEGINQGYSCHNFLIIEYSNDPSFLSDCETAATGLDYIHSKNIISKTLAVDGSNTFNPEISCVVPDVQCTVPNIIGKTTTSDRKVGLVDLIITDTDLIASGSGDVVTRSEVRTQNPTGGTLVDCDSTVTYTYN